MVVTVKPVKYTGLVALDMDNTILEGRFIDTVTAYLGKAEALGTIRSTITDPAVRTQMIAGLLKGVAIATLLEVTAGIPIVYDVKAVVSILKEKGYAVGIISDSYDCVTGWMMEKLELDFALSYQLEVEDGIVTGKVNIPDYYKKSDHPFCGHDICKSHAIQYISELYGVSRAETAAIGDSENDICMIRYAGTGMAFCTEDEQLKTAADYIITTRSFRDLLKIIPQSIDDSR